MYEPSFIKTTVQREEYWYIVKELATIYPFGLNDNLRKVGNISKKGIDNTVVLALFNRKIPLRPSRKHRTTTKDIETTLRNLIRNHYKPWLVHELQTIVFGILTAQVRHHDRTGKHPFIRM